MGLSSALSDVMRHRSLGKLADGSAIKPFKIVGGKNTFYNNNMCMMMYIRFSNASLELVP
jgi:hypothetical protein